MSMFSICTAFVTEEKLEETLAAMAVAEQKFTPEIGVLFRKFFQCTVQPHIIWAITEWESEKHHNDAAQSVMQTRRDDRIASISFGPEPYYEIFCNEQKGLGVGHYSDRLGFIVVAHGLINARARAKYRKLRRERIAELGPRLDWLRVYHNRYQPDEFVAWLGFATEEAFERVRGVGDLLLEEYLFTGLRKPFGMSYLAGYNQFLCTPLSLSQV